VLPRQDSLLDKFNFKKKPALISSNHLKISTISLKLKGLITKNN